MKTWVLGASDPEMQTIQAILAEHGQDYVLESKYNPVDVGADEVVFVECAPEIKPDGAVVVDHHRPGDPGHGQPPTKYFYASSVGQIIKLLELDICRNCGDQIDWACTQGAGGTPVMGVADCGYGGMSPCGDLHTWPLEAAKMAELRLVAAADHCLAAAYRGECPGVDPDALMRWRVASRAKYQQRSASEVLADVEATRLALRQAPHIQLGDGVSAVDMRHGGREVCAPDGSPRRAHSEWAVGPIAELPEAAAREGVGYVAGPFIGPDGRKFTCAGSPAQVKTWMEQWAPAHGLDKIYGDPMRGFAGGYDPDATRPEAG